MNQQLEECTTCDGDGFDPEWIGCSDAQCCGRPDYCPTCGGDGMMIVEDTT